MIEHMAIVMDGNRRWARSRGFLSMQGHEEGAKSIKRVVEFCLEKAIRHVSLYTFSIENFKRSEQEKKFLFNLLAREAKKGTDDFIKQGVRVRFVGDRSLFPEKLRQVINTLEAETEHLNNLKLNFLFCYGGRQEILDGTKKIACKVKAGDLHEDDISHDVLAKHMWNNGTPDPEIILRTGGMKRLSNFLLYQAAYSELYFLDCFWPDITQRDLEQVYSDFTDRHRRLGA